jgi:BlaI family transcriptional regulator, penicillinase repressor
MRERKGRFMDKPTPTNAELTLLQVLWDRGPCAVREVHDAVKDATG